MFGKTRGPYYDTSSAIDTSLRSDYFGSRLPQPMLEKQRNQPEEYVVARGFELLCPMIPKAQIQSLTDLSGFVEATEGTGWSSEEQGEVRRNMMDGFAGVRRQQAWGTPLARIWAGESTPMHGLKKRDMPYWVPAQVNNGILPKNEPLSWFDPAIRKNYAYAPSPIDKWGSVVDRRY